MLSAVVVAVVGLARRRASSRSRRGATPACRGGSPSSWASTTRGSRGFPENWVYNTGDEDNPIRRLVSTFLSPLASAYALVVALIYVASRPLALVVGLLVGGLLYVALLFTHTRAAFAALAFGLVLLAIAQRRVAAGRDRRRHRRRRALLFIAAYPTIGPSTSYTPDELEWLRANAEREGGIGGGRFPTVEDESTESHWTNLRDGVRVVLEHPQGHGLGNAGVVAKRTGVDIQAGESTYTELGVDAGIAGVVAFVLWSLAVLVGTVAS